MKIHALAAVLTCVAMLSVLSGCSRDKAARARHFVESGQHYFEQGKYDAAAIQFRRAIQSNPEAAEAHYRLGMADLQLHNLQEAYRSFTKASELDPRHTAALLQLAALKQVARHADESRMLLEKVIAIDPGNLDAHVLLGTASLEDHEYAGALRRFKQAQQIAPNDARVWAEEGDSYALMKRYSDAVESYQTAIHLNGTYLPAFINLSQVYRLQGDWKLEELTLRQAIQQNPKEIAPFLSLAQLYVRTASRQRIASLFDELRQATGDSALASMAIADFYRKVGDSASAKAELQHLLSKYPKNDVARMKLVEVDIERQEFDDAEKLNAELLNLYPNNPQIRLFHARLLFVHGNKAEAISAFEGLIHDTPEVALAHFYLGLAYAEEGQAERAIAQFNNTVAHNPDLIAAYVVLGELYSRQGDPKLALEFANKALARNPGFTSALLLQVNMLLQLGETGSAEKKLLQMADSQPNNPLLLERLGAVAAKKTQLAQAESRFEESLKAQPDYVPAMADLVQLYSLQNRKAKIVPRIREQINRAPKQSKFHEILGSVYLQRGDLKTAEEVMTKGLAANPQDDGLRLQLSSVYATTKRLPLAIRTVQEVLQRHSTYSTGYVLLGTMYEQSGSITDAQQAYQRALQIEPSSTAALNNLAWLYCENGGNLDLALGLAQHAKETLPADPSVADTLGWIEYKKGLYNAALQQLQEIARQRPANALYQYHVGMALLKVGNSNEAKQSLQRALGGNLNPNYVESAKTALAGLDRKPL